MTDTYETLVIHTVIYFGFFKFFYILNHKVNAFLTYINNQW